GWGLLPFLMTSGRTLLLQARELLLSRRSHDARWLRLHPQLPGADASGGWTELIEHVDVALADALAASHLAAAQEARLDLVADGQARTRAVAAENGGAGDEGELGIGLDGERVGLDETLSGELLAGQFRVVEERLHPQREHFVLVGQVLGAGGEQVPHLEIQRPGVAHDVGFAVLVDDLLLELPLLGGPDPDERAEIVEVEHGAGLVLAQEF